MSESLVTLGEVHTGLLHNSAAVSPARASRLLALIEGEAPSRSHRPIAYARSPEMLTGVDCLLPTATKAKVRGVGTAVSCAAITGGHVLQGSAYVTVSRGEAERRLGWSHYLSRRGVVETIGKTTARDVADGYFDGPLAAHHLDLGSIGRRAMDAVQDRADLDHQSAFRSARTRLRWMVAPAGSAQQSITFAVDDDRTRRVSLPHGELPVRAHVAFCEDLALHDWLLTTLLTLIEHSRIGAGARPDVVDRLRPAIDYLLHLWMPAARTPQALVELWREVEQRPGLSRQWQVNVDRVRDQLALAAIEKLRAS